MRSILLAFALILVPLASASAQAIQGDGIDERQESVPAAQAMYAMMLFLYAAGWCAIFGGLGYWVARQKSRQEGEGIILGVLFGPLGVLIESNLPVLTSRELAIKKAIFRETFEPIGSAPTPSSPTSEPPPPVIACEWSDSYVAVVPKAAPKPAVAPVTPPAVPPANPERPRKLGGETEVTAESKKPKGV